MELLGDFSVTIVEKLYPWKTWRDDFFKVFLVSTRLTLATKNWNGSKTLGSVLKNKFKSSAQISNQNIRKMYVTNLSFWHCSTKHGSTKPAATFTAVSGKKLSILFYGGKRETPRLLVSCCVFQLRAWKSVTIPISFGRYRSFFW